MRAGAARAARAAHGDVVLEVVVDERDVVARCDVDRTAASRGAGAAIAAIAAALTVVAVKGLVAARAARAACAALGRVAVKHRLGDRQLAAAGVDAAALGRTAGAARAARTGIGDVVLVLGVGVCLT